MKHGIYGITVLTELSDEQIELTLSKEALAEMKKAAGSTVLPVTYMIEREVQAMSKGTEFTVADMFILIHKNLEDGDARVIKIQTLRTTLASVSRKEKSLISVAERAAKSRLYKVK